MVIVYQIVHYTRMLVMVPWHVSVFVVRLAWRIVAGLWWLFVSVARPALRFLSFIALIVAIVALVADLTPALNGTADFRPARFAEHWGLLAPRSLDAAEDAVKRALGPLVWDFGLGLLITLPTFLLFGIASAVAGLAGRRRFAVDIYAN
ncbi:MAG: hypothetical protein NW217_00650 [Hyphomicrobiaceae bacterium]|nr:hypothetical protein [Hyphomicrobiaceae bacterium]